MKKTGFRLASIFTTNCVLQRDEKARIFGTVRGKDKLTLSLDGPMQAVVNAEICDGKFVFELPAMPAGGPYSIEVTDGDTVVTLENVMFGEVYLAGGQSNMEYELQNDKDWKGHAKLDENPNVRFYYTLKRGNTDGDFLAEEEKTRWELSGEEGMKHWSAVGYYFADKLAKETGVTVGVIGCNLGATSASCWISREDLLSEPMLREYVDAYEAGIEGKSEEEQIKEYAAFEAYHKEWEQKAAKCYAENPCMTWEEVQEECGVCKWPGPLNCRSPFRPGGLYETMIKRIAPYTMRGVLWYQGENDTDRPQLYEALLTKLIEVWRREFRRSDLTFYIVQLAMHRYLPDEDSMNWPIVRQAQDSVCRKINNCRLIMAGDYSMVRDIHPVIKKPIGERLCDAVIGKYRLPECIGHKMEGDHVRLYFSEGPLALLERRPLGMGGTILSDEELWETIQKTAVLVKGDGTSSEEGTESAAAKLQEYFCTVQCFELAGSDNVFHPAAGRIENGNEIVLVSDGVTEPKKVRYAWRDFVVLNLFTEDGYPVMPFQRELN